MKKLLLALGAILLGGAAYAQTPTFSENIAAIIYQHCTSCHRTGSIAPFPLETYADVTKEKKDIKQEVNDRTMPPWPPNPNYNHLAYERLLSVNEIQQINDWINGGMPEGDISKKPPLPTYPTGSVIGTPDLQVQIPDYYIQSNTDEFRCFAIPSGLSSDKYISVAELLPGNKAVVHHVLIFWDTTGVCMQLDTMDKKPGYDGFGGVGTSDAKFVGAWVPGSTPYPLPNGFGMPIPAGADIVMQFHFAPGSQNQMDNSKLNLFFTPTSSGIRPVYSDAILNHFSNIDAPLIIPANQVKVFNETYTVPFVDASIFGIAPHMHLIGTDIKSYAITPAKDTIPLIDIPDWSFHWQGSYNFRKVIKIPVGTKLKAVATYDNTSNNDENPNTPPKIVTAGEGTLNEMMLVFFQWSLYQPGDENIVMDSSKIISSTENVIAENPPMALVNAYPNPAADEVIVEFNAPQSGSYSLEVLDMMGRTVRTFFTAKHLETGYGRFMYSVGGLPAGNYFIRISGQGTQATNKLVVVK